MDAVLSDAAALGITVCVASGDNGSGDAVTDGQAHVDFPASSPYALGCGGTKLLADPSTGTISSEVVWNETASHEGAGGGGVSDQFPLPSWQANAGVPARDGGSSGGTGGASGGTGGSSGGTGGSWGGPGPTWRATPTRRPVIRSTQAARPRWWVEPARSLRCGRRWSAGSRRRP